MTVKLDSADKKILHQLQLNARQSISQIAKKTQLPRDMVKYRIKRLEKSKVVTHYRAVLDMKTLGYNIYVYVGFSLLNIEPHEEKELINYLKAQKQIPYVAKMSGRWDLSIGIAAKDYDDFDDQLREIRKRFSKMIKDFDAVPVIENYKYDWQADLV